MFTVHRRLKTFLLHIYVRNRKWKRLKTFPLFIIPNINHFYRHSPPYSTPGIYPPSALWTYTIPLLGTSGGHHWRPVQTWSLEALPAHCYRHLVVATYGWQAGAMHPSGMRSCHRPQGKVMFSEVSTGMLSCYRPQGRGVVAATATVGTHPTGMHSRCNFFFT